MTGEILGSGTSRGRSAGAISTLTFEGSADNAAWFVSFS